MKWKDNKLFIAIRYSAVTAIFLVTIFFTAIIPTWVEKYKLEIKKLEDAVPDYKKLKGDVELLKGENLKLKAELVTIYSGNVFKGGSIYPLGYREITLKSSLSSLEKIYYGNTINWSDDWVVVEIKHNLFKEITYHFDKKGKDKIVSIIGFRYSRVGKETYQILRKQALDELKRYKHTESNRNDLNELIFRNVKGADLQISDAGLNINEHYDWNE